jgi:deazaflavin-dependent oxidoreductase (nitroreductase family)
MVDLEKLDRNPTVVVTTKGRRTGNPHTVKIWFAIGNGKVYLTSARGMGADWVKNLRKNSQVTLKIGADTLQGEATWMEGPEVKERVLSLFLRKYFLARIFKLFRYYQQEFAFEVEPQEAP